jgi:hypothetical protein
MLTVNAVWRQDQELRMLERFFESVNRLGDERHWV